jgi:uncharacterized protein (DUF1330 family)
MVHVIIDVKVLDKEKYVAVAQKMPSTVQKFGGRYISRGGKVTTLSGSWRPDTVVIIEFDNTEQVNKWLKSREYAETVAIRDKTTISNLICVEGSL